MVDYRRKTRSHKSQTLLLVSMNKIFMIWPKQHKVEQLYHLGVLTRHTTDHLD
jgi:hypothetical protein